MAKVILPAQKHECVRPRAATIPLGAIVQCEECPQWFVRGEYYNGRWNDPVWYKVRWYNFGMKRKIREFERR